MKCGGNIFLKVQKKIAEDGSASLYASVVENKRIKGKTMQRTIVNIGRVEDVQVPFLKAAWSKEKPRLIWE
jgi:hypothetical protein